VFSALGELLWYLRGTDRLDVIGYYLPEYADSSDDGKTIHGAYGPRLLKTHGTNQIRTVIALLRRWTDSRRAVVQLFAATDLARRYKDVPCTCTWQFLLRERKLSMIASMRSNDAFLGLPHDVFTFTMMQELIARSVGAELGDYYHFVGSMHLYDRNREQARQYLAEGWQPTTSPMPPMPRGDPWPAVRGILRVEKAFRTTGKAPPAPTNGYWRDLIRLLTVFRLAKDDDATGIAALRRRMVSQVYDPYIEAKEVAARGPR